MTLARDKKRAQVTAKAAARKTRARVAKDEGESAAAEVRLPPWRELVGAGPAERQRSAGEAEEATAPPAEVEQVPADAKEDRPAPDRPDAAAAESPEPPALELEAPLDEPEVAEAPLAEAEQVVEPEPVPELIPEAEPESVPEPAPDLELGLESGPVAEPAQQVAASPAETVSEDAPVLRRSRDSTMPPVDRLGQARSLARMSRGGALPAGLEALLPGMPAPLLGEVSIHTDSAAARAAERLHADAFTIGTHVYFAEGRFAPRSSDGLALLAHELAHVAQFRTGRLAGLPALSQPSDAVEREADGWAARWRAPVLVLAPHGDSGPAGEPVRADATVAPDRGAAQEDDTAAVDAEPVNDGWSRPRAPPPDAPVLRRATDTARSFFDKSYFAQADEWSSVSGGIDGSLEADAQATTAAFPTPQAELGPASQAPTPAPAAPATLSLGEQVPEPGADTGQVRAEATESPAAPGTPATPRISFGADGDPSAAQRNFSAALDQVPTSLDGLETAPGPTPPVELTGAADPAQGAEQAQTADDQAEALRGQAAANVDNGPGPEQVQPRSIREAHPIEEAQAPTSEPLAEIGRMTEIESAGTVTDDIQAQTDAQGQEQIDATLAEAKTQLDDAATEADESQAEEARVAEEQNARLNAEANAEQQSAVSEARTSIEADKEDTKRQQQEQVDAAQLRSDEERQRLEDDVDARVADDEQRIDDEFLVAERDAEREKDSAEAEAERKKREAERDAENDSWWDRVANAIASAFAALTSFINDVFDAAISAVGDIIDAVKEAAAAIINAVRDFVVSALQALGEILTGLIDDLLGDLFPELAAALTTLVTAAVDLAVSAVNALADGLIAGINALLDAIGGAISAILEAYRAAINAALAFAQALLTGDWAALGRMILEAVLTLAGIPPEAFYALIAQAMGALDTIIDDPGAFVGNVIDAVAEGFRKFADNILTHLREGFFRWIVGPLGELGITLPTTWDVVGILGLVLQVLGLTAAGIRSIIVEVLGGAAGAIFDFVWRYVDALIIGGWAGLWEQIQNDLSQLWSTVVDGIKNYLIETIVTQAVLRIATMFNPVGALLNAIVMVWNVYNFLRTNIQRIWGVVTSIVDMLATIVAGNITPAAQAVENAIASLIPIAISLLANLLGLGGLTTKVREVLESLRAAVRNAIVSLVRRVRGLFGGAAGGEEGEDDDVETITQSFSMDGEGHALRVKMDSGEVTMASEERDLGGAAGEGAERAREAEDTNPEMSEAALAAITDIRAKYDAVKSAITPPENLSVEGTKERVRALSESIGQAMTAYGSEFQVKDIVSPLPGFGPANIGPHPATSSDEEQPDGRTRVSHHNPPKQLAPVLKSELEATQQELAGKNTKPAQEAAARVESRIDGMQISGEGTGLIAISLHRRTHSTAGGAGVHSEQIRAPIVASIDRIESGLDQKLIRIINETDNSLAVNPQTTQFTNWLVRVRTEVRARYPDPAEQSAALSEVSGAAAQANREEAAAVAEAAQIETQLSAIIAAAFRSSYYQGKGALDTALGASSIDGDRDEALSDVNAMAGQATSTWQSKGIIKSGEGL